MFYLGGAGAGINPPAKPVTLKASGFTTTTPPVSFKATGFGPFMFPRGINMSRDVAVASKKPHLIVNASVTPLRAQLEGRLTAMVPVSGHGA
jgi:hypothetical protein